MSDVQRLRLLVDAIFELRLLTLKERKGCDDEGCLKDKAECNRRICGASAYASRPYFLVADLSYRLDILA